MIRKSLLTQFTQTGVKQGSNKDQTGAKLVYYPCLILVWSLFYYCTFPICY